jgi:hypothetical protein
MIAFFFSPAMQGAILLQGPLFDGWPCFLKGDKVYMKGIGNEGDKNPLGVPIFP